MGLTRRRLLQLGGAGLAAVAGAAGGSAWWLAQATPTDRALRFSTLDDALRELDRLTNAVSLAPTVAFTWGQTLAHAAQSIEYSLIGYPEAKPALFQATVGRAAVGVFSALGRMHHDLGAPIPGAPDLLATTDPHAAAQRLRLAIRDFSAWSGELAPHFAYGKLDKPSFARAHAMHLAEHFSLFEATKGPA